MSKETNSTGVGVIGLLGVAFVVLKLTGVIDWSWWWVTLPFWGVLTIILVIIVLATPWLIYRWVKYKKSKTKWRR